MSPIGRVFVVLNLVLAAVFVGFAGTYLHGQPMGLKAVDSQPQGVVERVIGRLIERAKRDDDRLRMRDIAEREDRFESDARIGVDHAVG